MQLGLRAAGLCSILVLLRAVVCQDGCPKRWCWQSALCVTEQLDAGTEAPKALVVLRASTLCRVGDVVAFGAVLMEVRFLHQRGSSHSSHGVFSSTWVGGRLILMSVLSVVPSVFSGLALGVLVFVWVWPLLYLFLPVFR